MNSVPNQLNDSWKQVDWVLTDVDDTLTWHGRLPPETLIALDKLQKAGIKVVAVTGACAGWCDQIAQLWPVDAVLGENGAFILRKENGFLVRESQQSFEELAAQQNRLKKQVLTILEDYPDLALTLDQSYRLCEVSIDIGQNRPKADSKLVSEVIARIHALGAQATASSIHINAWYGEHSKKHTSLNYLHKNGLTSEDILRHCCYVGDSANDQVMFEHLKLTAGVANIEQYWDMLSAPPSVVMSEPGGYGFAEFAEQLIRIKS